MALVQVTQAQGKVPVTVFQIQDRVNLGNYKELEQAAKDAFDNGMQDLVIDLSKSDSLTSIGIRALVVIYKMLSTDDRKHLKLSGVILPIRDMLQVAGVTQFIEIYDTVDDALTSFQ